VTFLWELVAVAVGTYGLRASVILVASRTTMAPRVEATLRLIPPAVLSALVANALVLDHGEVRPFGPWYLAAAIAAVVALRTRSSGWTLLSGMAAVWALSALW
jgi:branched-subunit amino acid transport protein